MHDVVHIEAERVCRVASTSGWQPGHRPNVGGPDDVGDGPPDDSDVPVVVFEQGTSDRGQSAYADPESEKGYRDAAQPIGLNSVGRRREGRCPGRVPVSVEPVRKVLSAVVVGPFDDSFGSAVSRLPPSGCDERGPHSRLEKHLVELRADRPGNGAKRAFMENVSTGRGDEGNASDSRASDDLSHTDSSGISRLVVAVCIAPFLSD
jgi:hypothetical protein